MGGAVVVWCFRGGGGGALVRLGFYEFDDGVIEVLCCSDIEG